MAPKAKGGKKDGPAKFADKENLARAETEVLSLQRLLELRSYEVRRVGLMPTVHATSRTTRPHSRPTCQCGNPIS